MSAETLWAESALINQNLTTTSLIVSDRFKKRHDDVLRRIDRLEVPEAFRLRNFAERFRTVSHGPGMAREYRYFELTRDGFTLLVMGFTGKRAMEWKITFLEAFNAMEAALAGQAQIAPRDERMQRLMTYLDLVLMDESMMAGTWRELDRVRNIARGLDENRATEALPGKIFHREGGT